MQKRWELKTQGNTAIVERLSTELNIDKTLSNLLVQRGIQSFDEAKYFFRPSLENLNNPFLMKDMDIAVNRLQQAIQKNENILIYGDYDVDGTTAVALVYSFLISIYPNVAYYIPDRYTEGYGISFQGIDFAADNDFSLIIALDCGIKANEKINYANEKNIDFIICDHHLPGDELPEAVAVLDPKRTDCDYPFKELSGCGIGFKLIQAYSERNNVPFENLLQYLDLLVCSIASDIVPIVDENRILAHFGLEKINKNPCVGIKALLELSALKKNMTISDVVFILGPRINAAGRIANGKSAVELLISDKVEDAKISGQILNENNSERKGLDTEITQQALTIIEENEILINKKTTVLFHPDWHKGVIGIVASRLIEKYYRPTIMLTSSNGKATGSARSVKDYDVYSAIEKCSDLLEQFGGHKAAAGLTMKIENIGLFTERFEKIVSETIEEHLLIPSIEIDAEINLSDITSKFFRVLKQFAPFGPGNMNPVFVTRKIKDKGYAKIVGRNHLKLEIVSPNDYKKSFSAIAFHQAHLFDRIEEGNLFDICYSLEENQWNGTISIQLNIKDIKF